MILCLYICLPFLVVCPKIFAAERDVGVNVDLRAEIALNLTTIMRQLNRTPKLFLHCFPCQNDLNYLLVLYIILH